MPPLTEPAPQPFQPGDTVKRLFGPNAGIRKGETFVVSVMEYTEGLGGGWWALDQNNNRHDAVNLELVTPAPTPEPEPEPKAVYGDGTDTSTYFIRVLYTEASGDPGRERIHTSKVGLDDALLEYQRLETIWNKNEPDGDVWDIVIDKRIWPVEG